MKIISTVYINNINIFYNHSKILTLYSFTFNMLATSLLQSINLIFAQRLWALSVERECTH